jgi:UDP-N-acetyl-D-galactosamine dehydrogenase
VLEQVVKTMIKNNLNVNLSDILMLGFTFKENCPDVRNTKIIDVVQVRRFWNQSRYLRSLIALEEGSMKGGIECDKYFTLLRNMTLLLWALHMKICKY